MYSLGILPSMRRAYQTDLSDAEWSCLEFHLPAPKAKMGVLVSILFYARSSMPSSLCAQEWLCLATASSRLPSLEETMSRTTSSPGVWRTVPGRGCTPPCVSERVRGYAWRGIPSLVARPSWIESQSIRTTGVGGKERGSLHLRGDEPPDGEEIGSLVRVFRQFHNGVLRSSA